MGMLRKYKREQKTAQDEIEKLTNLNVVKQNEIEDLNQEIELLKQIQADSSSVFEDKFVQARRMLADNEAIIKRQDKLIVDLQQKNELCQIRKAQTIEDI